MLCQNFKFFYFEIVKFKLKIIYKYTHMGRHEKYAVD